MTTQTAVQAAALQETGFIQPFGALVAVDMESEVVVHASDNCADFIGLGATAEQLIGASVHDALGSTVTHALRNVCALPSIKTRSEFLGFQTYGDIGLEVSAHRSSDVLVVEFGPVADTEPSAASVLKDVAQLNDRIRDQQDDLGVLTNSVSLLRTISGYDNVLVYRFRPGDIAEVVAESRRPSADSRIGSCVPRWSMVDEPQQAAGLAVRLITDIARDPVPVLSDDTVNLDLSRAQLRAVQPAQRLYMESLGSTASMTWILGMDGRSWGALSFHHKRARVPSTRVRQVCEAFLPQLNATLALRSVESELRGFAS